MLTQVVINIISFFYPIGNTPAVCLTQDLPPEQHADILLLGCGDVRNILFTTYSENTSKPRQLDITCCDIERAILARNILLFTLLIDDVDCLKDSSIWNIYYHFYIDDRSLELLHVQSKKLYILADSMESWHQSEYGRTLRFCDQGTLTKVREVWNYYSISDLADKERAVRDKKFKTGIQKGIQARTNFGGPGPVLTGVKSAAPICIQAWKDLPELYQHYWDEGVTDNDRATVKARHSNPMFASLNTDNFTLHYGTDPLLGFHLATAYAPLTLESPMRPKAPRSSLHKVVAAARLQFRAWATSFRKYASQNLTLRFSVGDALAFSHTLQHKRANRSDISAHWSRTPYCSEPLKLDSTDYDTSGKAPLSFNVIDTSNLVDHLGALNILVATSMLLQNSISATIYTESLVRRAGNHRDWMDEILCGHFPTISILLGLFPVECWTNATAVSTLDEGILDETTALAEGKISGGGQMHSRLAWKRPISASHSIIQTLYQIRIAEGDLAHILYQVYLKMFQHEDMKKLFSKIDLLTIRNSSLLQYHRGSFVSFLCFVKRRVEVNWSKMMEALLNLIENDSNLLMGRNYIQELYLHLHLLDVYSYPSFLPPFIKNSSHRDSISFSAWKNIPGVVCVTITVPRNKLGVFTSLPLNKLGTPIINCILESAGTSLSMPWQNLFAAVQLNFGTVTTLGSRNMDDFRLHVIEDESGWKGGSPLIVSFYAPTWVALLEPTTTIVAVGIQSTPMSTQTFVKTLGLEMHVYDTILADEDNVFITKYHPNQSRYASICDFADADIDSRELPSELIRTSVIANVERKTAKFKGFTGHVDFLSEEVKSALRDQSPVEAIQISPCVIAVIIGKGRAQHLLHFPAPVLNSRSKTRVARKSSYVEVTVPMVGATKDDRFPHFMYPLFQMGRSTIIWNMPYLNLKCLPILDTAKRRDLQWLITHTSLQWSARERKLRDESIVSASEAHEDVRVNFKESLFSMFMYFSGLQGKKASIFGINNPAAGGVNIIVFVSCLRLDMANHTVVLDSAVLPLTHKLMPQIQDSLLPGLSSRGLCNVKVDEDEMRLWKEVLPVYVERCRQWEHSLSCEYATKSQIPLSVEFGEPLLCSCGNGILPPKFISGLPEWENFSKYTVRAAISPCFSVPFIEQIFDLDEIKNSVESNINRCRNCQKDKSSDGTSLMTCSRCHIAKYCSAQCQRADWKSHKNFCAN